MPLCDYLQGKRLGRNCPSCLFVCWIPFAKPASHCFVQNAAMPRKRGPCQHRKLNPVSMNCVSIAKLLLCSQNSFLKLDEANDGHMRTRQPWPCRPGDDNFCSHVPAVVEETLSRAASVQGTSASASGAGLTPDQQSCTSRNQADTGALAKLCFSQ